MKKTIYLLTAFITLTLTSCKDDHANLADGLYAEIETSKGSILVSLDYKKTPVTVANFVSLAEGTNTFVSNDFKGKPFFDGLKFHRVLPNFMIQGGDPLGNGSGDAGYKFKDEITDEKFDKGGLLAMANSGPGTNSSQFFITHLETPWLNGKHTIFGRVVENGMEVVNTIVQDDVINSISIIRKGEDAKKFKADKVFTDYFSVAFESQKADQKISAEKAQKIIAEKVAFFKEQKTQATKLPSGLAYHIIKKGSAQKTPSGTPTLIAYSGYLENGTLFDSSDIETVKAFGMFDPQRAAQNGYQTLPYTVGSNGGMIVGFEEGLKKMNVGDKAILFIPTNLAYGENGAGKVIPPYANIIFEVEMLEKK